MLTALLGTPSPVLSAVAMLQPAPSQVYATSASWLHCLKMAVELQYHLRRWVYFGTSALFSR